MAVFRNVDVRQKLASSAMGREKSHCTAKTWARDMIKEGKEARVKLNYTTLRVSLAGKLEKEKCLPLPTHALWSYAKDVMDKRLREFNAGPARNKVPKEAEDSHQLEEEEKRTQT